MDDEPNVTWALRRVFHGEPYETLRASSVREALGILASREIDVVVSDEKMPEMRGSEFLAVVRREYPNAIRMVLTGEASLDAAIRAINEGQVYRFFTKPCNEVEVKTAIRQALHQKELMLLGRRLLRECRRQITVLGESERQNPGIGSAAAAEGGAVLVDSQDDMADLLARMAEEIRAAPSSATMKGGRNTRMTVSDEITTNGAGERYQRDMESFAYITSHALKEPLRGISGYSKLLVRDYSDELGQEGRERLETLSRLATHMETLVDSLPRFARAGELDLGASPADLNRVVDEVLGSLQLSIEQAGVAVRVLRPLPHVRCDRSSIGEVFRNLVTNGLKYNDKTNKWIEIGSASARIGRDATAGADDGRQSTVLYVRDNGIGIDERHLDKVFGMFRRLHGRDEFGGGTGAGLAVVKRIVELHGGRVWVESCPGEGATFYFSLWDCEAEDGAPGRI